MQALVIVPKAEYIPFIVKNKLCAGDEIKSDIDRYRDNYQQSAGNDEDLRNDLILVCSMALSKDEDRRAEAQRERYKKPLKTTPETLGSIAHSCVILCDVDMLERCINLADDGLTVSSFSAMGCAMPLDAWPSMKAR